MLLYIHIPFCDSKCHYCAFNSYTSLHHLKDDYVDALCKQLEDELRSRAYDSIKTIFIGGGTPSTLTIKHYKQIFNILDLYLDNIDEITIEANPNSATPKWLKDMYSLGINRISFGVQSFNDKKLEFLGRNHTSQMAISAINEASRVGFKHINCDIIYDTTLDTQELLDNDLTIIKSLPIDHISAYSLTLEDGTKFYNKTNVKVDDENLARYLFKQLEKLGFNQYEISNFAKNNNSKSKHNIGYWKHQEYLGCGAGAVGYKERKRLYTFKDVNMYINSPTNYDYTEDLSSEDIKVEKVLLGLRCEIGIDANILNDKELNKLYILEKEDKILFDKNLNRYYALDFLIADEIALYILD